MSYNEWKTGSRKRKAKEYGERTLEKVKNRKEFIVLLALARFIVLKSSHSIVELL